MKKAKTKTFTLYLKENNTGTARASNGLDMLAGFSLTPYLESFTPTFGLGTPVFPRISSNLHCGTPTFSKRCLWDSYFQNPSENLGSHGVLSTQIYIAPDCKNMTNNFIKGYCMVSSLVPEIPLINRYL